MMVYDLCVVGCGLWGSAAARHATKRAGNVCLIGPSEPRQKDYLSRDIFASYYDSGRQVREYQGTSHIRSLISKRTFASYKELERTTGIKLITVVGHIMYGHYVRDYLVPITESQGIFLGASGVRNRFPFLDTKQYGDTAFFLPRHAGYLDPCLLVRAQQEAAKRQGCDVIDDVVEVVDESKQRDGETMMRLTTKSGRTLFAKKVLLCTGAFTELKNLLPKGVKLDFGINGTYVVKLEVGEKDLEKLLSMPTLTSFTDPGWNCYMLPPIKYPNGKYYIKIGPGSKNQQSLRTLEEVKDWYLSHPNPKQMEKMKDILLSIVKGFTPVSMDVGMCVCARTPTTNPYCDMVSPRLGLAIGGNGYGAMLSDEMGRMAAAMMAGTENWNLDIPREDLKVRYIQPSSNL